MQRHAFLWHYTYAEVPLGFWMEKAFHLVRNDYDRIGHLAQGFVPAMVARREILIRRNVVRSNGWRYFIIVAICLAISAAYELLEWRVSVATGSAGDAFLGTQGDIWDTQEDGHGTLRRAHRAAAAGPSSRPATGAAGGFRLRIPRKSVRHHSTSIVTPIAQ
jgi:putative membrane protein